MNFFVSGGNMHTILYLYHPFRNSSNSWMNRLKSWMPAPWKLVYLLQHLPTPGISRLNIQLNLRRVNLYHYFLNQLLCASCVAPPIIPLLLLEIQGDGRKQHLSKYPHCMNCLGAGHSLKQCHSKRSCRDCGQRHHSILHVEVTPQVPQPTDTAAASSTGTQQAMVAKPDQVSLGNQLQEKTSLVWMCQVILEKEDAPTC